MTNDDNADDSPAVSQSSTENPPAATTRPSRFPRAALLNHRLTLDEGSDLEAEEELVPAPKPKSPRSVLAEKIVCDLGKNGL